MRSKDRKHSVRVVSAGGRDRARWMRNRQQIAPLADDLFCRAFIRLNSHRRARRVPRRSACLDVETARPQRRVVDPGSARADTRLRVMSVRALPARRSPLSPTLQHDAETDRGCFHLACDRGSAAAQRGGTRRRDLQHRPGPQGRDPTGSPVGVAVERHYDRRWNLIGDGIRQHRWVPRRGPYALTRIACSIRSDGAAVAAYARGVRLTRRRHPLGHVCLPPRRSVLPSPQSSSSAHLQGGNPPFRKIDHHPSQDSVEREHTPARPFCHPSRE